MSKFIKNLLSNRTGIVLAAVNVCYLANAGIDPPYPLLFILLNLPAAVLTSVSEAFDESFVPGSFLLLEPTITGFFAVFIVIQWLLIGRSVTPLARPDVQDAISFR